MDDGRPVAADYAWVEDGADGGLFSAYCLTLVRGVSPAEFLTRLGADVRPGPLPLGDEFVDLSFQYWGAPHYGDVQLIGATVARGGDADWTLAFEVNGHLGVTPSVMAPVAAGTTLVSHRYNGGNGVGWFHWLEDGVVRVEFEPLFATNRGGSTPDALLDDMARVGLDLSGAVRDEVGPTTTAAFALAERLTGVRVTPALLDDALFWCGTVADH
ncbi:DUF6461 domain-containing protein [Actinocatenispora rupis]|uniref:Uncharacterized protein n=1 Tax=Actinocatenispora rupis TaxID=519421 RepID=A0A8J3NAS6_9ACTN|nr:DUF6461 domain-containing protein [Actinocatenispora rupis]GID09862.1 hypothetical protein Aru02nite_07510 [Actinocatenispora rupis]